MSKLLAIKAAQQGGDNPYLTPVALATWQVNGLTHYQAQLEKDRLRLKAITDIPAKIEAKREMLDTYRPYIKEWLASGQTTRNPLAVQVMIWLFDVGDIDAGLPLALTLIEQGQTMPDQFNSTMETFVCDYTYDWANKLLAKNESASPYLDSVVEAIDAHHYDLSPPVASKMYALLAKFKFSDNQFADVVALCTRAEMVNPEGHGTKTLKKKAQEKL